MIDTVREMFSLGFMTRAVIVGTLISLCAALLGVSLVLKRFSMIGDGLSHVGFGALAVAAALNAAPLAVAIPVTVAAAFLLLRLGNSKRIKGDAAIALISAGALAAGVVISYLSGNSNSELSNYLFGSSALFIKSSDLPASIALACAVIVLFILLYNRVFAVTFDETFAKASGARTGLINALISVLTAVTVVLGMRLMGALLISALLIIPALSAMRVFGTFRGVTVTAAVMSVCSFFIGSVVSYALELPYGAAIVLTELAVFGCFCAAAGIK
ncbi:MAG: metal ABC transporter permease, partial [Clostridia bacterium]|nr:metal ABC transporter permease [Clostridia bacterium]